MEGDFNHMNKWIIGLAAAFLAALFAYIMLRPQPEPAKPVTTPKQAPAHPMADKPSQAKPAPKQQPLPGQEFTTVDDDGLTYFGSTDPDLMEGDDEDNMINGGDGNDRIKGGLGKDHLKGSAGNDYLLGEEGDDFVKGGPGDDRLDGGDGEDRIYGGEGNDSLSGGTGNDSMRGGDGDDVVEGNEGDDHLEGDVGHDVFYGGPGKDLIETGDGNDIAYGGDGDDEILGQEGDDTIGGGPGADMLSGAGGADRFVYEPGDASGGADTIRRFAPREGDVVDVSSLLRAGGYRGDGSVGSLSNWVEISGSMLRVDPTGRAAFVDLADLGRPYSLDELVNNRNLIAGGN